MLEKPKGFRDHPYPYHHEIHLEVESVTNLGLGIARDEGWVIQIPFVLPGEKIRARIFRNNKNYSDADCIEVLQSSPNRISPKCELFGICGGCQYQSVDYKTQLDWKRNQVKDSFLKIGELKVQVNPVVASPRAFGYRSKLTPHYEKTKDPRSQKIGFLRYGTRKVLVDVPHCPIATDSINKSLSIQREQKRAEPKGMKKGGTLLLRETLEGVVTNPKQTVSEKVGKLVFQFKAGEFFQTNPFILKELVDYVIAEANPLQNKSLIDSYCGGGLFSLSAAGQFERVVGVEISRDGFEGAIMNAKINQIKNAEFFLGDSSSIFSELSEIPKPCSLVVDPPRKGCDSAFLSQAIAFCPKRIIYVSCDPATQARDAKIFVNQGYRIVSVQPFDLFPQTRHIENVLTLEI